MARRAARRSPFLCAEGKHRSFCRRLPLRLFQLDYGYAAFTLAESAETVGLDEPVAL